MYDNVMEVREIINVLSRFSAKVVPALCTIWNCRGRRHELLLRSIFDSGSKLSAESELGAPGTVPRSGGYLGRKSNDVHDHKW